MANSTLALIILVLTIISFVWGKIPLAATAVSSALAMALFGIITPAKAFSGFSSDVAMVVTGYVIIGETLFETGVAQAIGKSIVKICGTNERMFLVACLIVSTFLSSFLGNVAVVAMMIPVVASTAASSGGKIEKKTCLMAIGFGANVGGGMTLVGSTPNVIGQGLLTEAGYEGMGFFDLTLGSIPRLIFMIVFYATIGYTMQKKVFDFPDVVDESASTEVEKVYDKKKMALAAGILVGTIALLVAGCWTVGAVGMLGGMMCIITGLINMKDLFHRMDWNTIWVLAGSVGFAAGISESGAGKLIADTLIGFLGDNITMFNILLVFSIIGLILGNIMSSTAAMAMLGPIAISLCQSLGYEPKPVIMAIVWALNLAFLTPIATPTVTMTLQGGYRFLDYTKMGLPLTIGCFVLTVVCFPLVFGL